MLSTIYSGIIATRKILETVDLSIYQRQRLEDSLFYLEKLYEDKKIAK
ncbi:hypothetical protein PQE75_gp151 [Bacillus phage vB_BcoS-136]|uniref:Uncharacterized protein n=1 Tax=Bacillus phage vB_BcoS-136 TaxID=2419619 RepID=A0A3G3BVP5_9CAUD|nr:hypothetical protein PQE75_gp151 [Bacillus phage vB_BcoS-136]AYP68328.1 hypothetical protein vBBcoS136_00214 [Bacillus phage vB_BcoS-136]